MLGIYKLIAAFGDAFFPDLTCKLIQATKQIGMDLLQTLGGTYFKFINQITFKKGIGLFLLCPSKLVSL